MRSSAPAFTSSSVLMSADRLLTFWLVFFFFFCWLLCALAGMTAWSVKESGRKPGSTLPPAVLCSFHKPMCVQRLVFHASRRHNIQLFTQLFFLFGLYPAWFTQSRFFQFSIFLFFFLLVFSIWTFNYEQPDVMLTLDVVVKIKKIGRTLGQFYLIMSPASISRCHRCTVPFRAK